MATLTNAQRKTLESAASNRRGEVSYIPGMGFDQPRTLMALFRLGLMEDRGGWVGRITDAGRAALAQHQAKSVRAESGAIKRHRWNNGDTCVDCGLHREGAGAGPYGAMRYYRDGERLYHDKPGVCPDTHARETEAP